jgi:type IV secretion system protein VirB11
VSYLKTYLEPIAGWLERDDVTDIMINRPGELWVEAIGKPAERVEVPALDEGLLWRLSRQIASQSHQGVSREHPLLAAVLPDGSRVQVCAPPCTRGPIALAIRKHAVADMMLDDYEAAGAFEGAQQVGLNEASAVDVALQALLDAHKVADFLRGAVRARKTIVVSGGTSTGKTTFLNALLQEAPRDERLIVIEDTPEVRLVHPNAVGLVAVRGALGESAVGPEELLQAALRLRPDRIIMGELRGKEAFQFLRAVNSGHPGSITTVHADTPAGARDQIALMALQAGVGLGRFEVVEYVMGVVDVFVQLSRQGGCRRVIEILFTPLARESSAS